MEYVLILTLTMFGGQHNAMSGTTSIEHIGGFATNAECLAAGNAWIDQQKVITSNMQRKHQSALCVVRTKSNNR